MNPSGEVLLRTSKAEQILVDFYNRKGIKGYETCRKNYDIEKAAWLVAGRTGTAAFCIPPVRIEMGEWSLGAGSG